MYLKTLKQAEKPYFVHTHTHTHTHTQVRFAEQGRSMVEVLGVLSIMGILSLAGLKIYNSAVNSHRANELIYEANKRATMVAAQIMAGREKNALSVAEFSNHNGHTFGVEANPKNEKQFNITITGVSSDVCQKMKTTLDEGSTVRSISEFCDKLTFNDDLSKIAYASDIQTKNECVDAGKIWCGGIALCSETNSCCEGKKFSQCQTCNEGAIVTGSKEGTLCDYNQDQNANDGICHLGVCEPLPNGVNCENGICLCNGGQGRVCRINKNTNAVAACCSPGSFCSANGDVVTGPNGARCVRMSGCGTNADCPAETPWCKITEYDDCWTPKTGVCSAKETPLITSIYGIGEVFISPSNMNWGSAKNWCELYGKHLINVEDLQVYRNGETLLKTSSGSGCYACAKGKSCHRWDQGTYAVMWKGNSGDDARVLTGARDANGELYSNRYSPIVVDFAKSFKQKKNFWLASDLNTGDCCESFYLYLNDGLVHHAERNNIRFSALCQ